MPVKLFCATSSWDASKEKIVNTREIEIPDQEFIIFGEDISERLEDYQLEYAVKLENGKITKVELLENGLYEEFKKEMNSEYFLKLAENKAKELISELEDGEGHEIPVFLTEEAEAELSNNGFNDSYLKYV